ncbi:hypothetical protein WJX74_010911 [Apatococcus lobatus]|uniref:Glycosyl transferase CAP10 domain-containing protein n=1 Tax=Apatococcus lobatus TaxID=904363 RepID=A0AAW1RT12_9CHLO
MQPGHFDTTITSRGRDRKSDRMASVVLQLAVTFLLGSAVFLLAYSYSVRPAPGKVQWKPKARAAGPTDPASLLKLLPAAAGEPASPPDPPRAFFQSIEQDLAPWNMTGITSNHVESAYCSSRSGAFRLQIIGGQMYIVGEQESFQTRGHSVKMMLLQLQNTFGDQLPDVDIGAFSTGDLPGGSEPRSGCPEAGPIFCFSKRPEDVQAVRWPDFGFYDWPEAHAIPWEFFTVAIEKAARALPWQSRTSQLFHRAAAIGETRVALRDTPQEVSENPLWNVKIIDWAGDKSSFVSVLDHCKYRYLLHTAGNTYSGRMKYLPFCGSAIVMPHSPWEEFWYGMLEHGKNVYRTPAVNNRQETHIALTAAEALVQDDALAQTIAQGAHDLAVNVLTTRNIELFMLALLKRYAELMDFKVALHPDAITIEESLMGQNFRLPEQRTCPADCRM